jgi:hypothetical protein
LVLECGQNPLGSIIESLLESTVTRERFKMDSTGARGRPCAIAVLETKGGSVTCRELDAQELLSHAEAVTNAEKHLRDINQKPPAAAPPIPVPPAV